MVAVSKEKGWFSHTCLFVKKSAEVLTNAGHTAACCGHPTNTIDMKSRKKVFGWMTAHVSPLDGMRLQENLTSLGQKAMKKCQTWLVSLVRWEQQLTSDCHKRCAKSVDPQKLAIEAEFDVM